MSGHRFSGRLGDDRERPLVELPAEVVEALGARGRIPVAGTIDGTPYRTSTMPMGGGGTRSAFAPSCGRPPAWRSATPWRS